jgi:hypothetical protein
MMSGRGVIFPGSYRPHSTILTVRMEVKRKSFEKNWFIERNKAWLYHFHPEKDPG